MYVSSHIVRREVNPGRLHPSRAHIESGGVGRINKAVRRWALPCPLASYGVIMKSRLLVSDSSDFIVGPYRLRKGKHAT